MAKSKAIARREDVEVLPAEGDEQQLVKDVNVAITAFVRNVVAFFATAKALKKKADARLMAAKTLKAPIDKAGDEVLQKFITNNAADKKAAEAHWHPIKSAVWGFHRWLCAKEKPTVDAHDEAHRIAQPLHNKWVESETRRVAREAEERRIENERLAQVERDRELQRLEDAALKAEGASAELSAREQNFVRLVLLWGPSAASRAARESGFKNADATAVRLLSTAKITKAIDGLRQAAAVREQATARAAAPLEVEEVVEEKAQVGGAGRDVERWTGEILDEAATVEAFRSGKHGIPGDLFQINPVKLNEYARSLRERLDLWPGVHGKKSTRTQ